jgi:serine/threonine protein phosphatase PrpC
VTIIVGDECITATVGDSLAFLDTGETVLQISGNHRVDDNASERERVVAAGGSIDQADLDGEGVGPLRVWPGGLAFTRCVPVLGLLLW